jgi:nitroimidazol reductase NimA-like FMN-containing flavoprotein (pyridoxamine 5'-phosphate oxidase superfamily)
MTDDLTALGRQIVDNALYLVLGTADADGRPWASPVYFAHDNYRDLIWVSKPEARHSRNIEVRPEVSVVVFDSSVPIGTGRGAVYMPGTAKEVSEAERDEALATFSRRSIAHGGREFTEADVLEPARLRLYKAIAAEQFVLDDRDNRVALTL